LAPGRPGCQDFCGPIPSVFLDKLSAKIGEKEIETETEIEMRRKKRGMRHAHPFSAV
jgi:hypothetical protein